MRHDLSALVALLLAPLVITIAVGLLSHGLGAPIWAYLASLLALTLTAIVLCISRTRRYLSLLLLCSVAVCIVAGSLTFWLYPAIVPESALVTSADPLENFALAYGRALAPLIDSWIASAIGLLLGWIPFWLYRRYVFNCVA
jgi:hypothetical protein